MDWHAACLKCAECKKSLDGSGTCFVKDGRILCKDDYNRCVQKCMFDLESGGGYGKLSGYIFCIRPIFVRKWWGGPYLHCNRQYFLNDGNNSKCRQLKFHNFSMCDCLATAVLHFVFFVTQDI